MIRRPRVLAESGSVLILVVWVVSLLSMLAAGLGSHGLSALGLVDRLDQRLQASYIATGAAQHAIQVLAADSTPMVDGFTDNWANCETCFRNRPLADGYFSISYAQGTGSIAGLLDEDRKLSLNTMPAEVFSALLARRGQLKPIEADEVAAAIVDWRDKDHEESEHGAEGFYYQGLSPSYRCKDAPFQQVEELLLIKGMTLDVYERVAPWVTAYGSGELNVNTAPAPAFEALGLSPAAVSAILSYRDGDDSRPGSGDERVFGSPAALVAEMTSLIPADDLARLTQVNDAGLLGVRATAFSGQIQAVAEGDRVAATADFVIDRHGSILAWVER